MQQTRINIHIPVVTVSELNSREHWTVKRRRHKLQQAAVRHEMAKIRTEIPLPCDITMTRVSYRTMDTDNLQGAFKYVRDEIAETLLPEYAATYRDHLGRIRRKMGRADDDPRLKWHYAQERGKGPLIKISFSPLSE